jgi:NAD dependent epimerase/dehydratase family enzyme
MTRVINEPALLPYVPAFILRSAQGEMSDVILKGSRVSSEKIIKFGYEFLYPDPEKTLDHIPGDKNNRDK